MRFAGTILASLTLTACSLPDAFNAGSVTAAHPTQEPCSHGQTLDAATKHCVVPTPSLSPLPSAAATTGSPPSAPATTGSLPSEAAKTTAPPSQDAKAQPPPAPPQPESRRDVVSVQIEPGATIEQDSDAATLLAHFVRGSGYRCGSISALHTNHRSHKIKLACDHSAHEYLLEETDGRWSVTPEQ